MSDNVIMDESKAIKDVLPKIPKVELFTSVDELPIARYQFFQNYMLQDSGNGSSLSAINMRFAKMDEYDKNGLHESAMIERRNLNVSFWSVFEKINFRHMAYAALVKKIGSKDYSKVLTESGVKEIHEHLTEHVLKHKVVVEATKKKRKHSKSSWLNTFQKNLERTQQKYSSRQKR